jgi:ketosteroid isomerase-like protein
MGDRQWGNTMRVPERVRMLASALCMSALPGLAGAADSAPVAATTPQQQVEATERAFARSMAERDLTAFTRFISEEAVFMSADRPLRGRQQVIDAWRPFFREKLAPFSWEPQTVEVLDSGHLALSRGPVHDAAGKLIATFNSVWRLEAPGTWRIIFDSGCDACTHCSPGEH